MKEKSTLKKKATIWKRIKRRFWEALDAEVPRVAQALRDTWRIYTTDPPHRHYAYYHVDSEPDKKHFMIEQHQGSISLGGSITIDLESKGIHPMTFENHNADEFITPPYYAHRALGLAIILLPLMLLISPSVLFLRWQWRYKEKTQQMDRYCIRFLEDATILCDADRQELSEAFRNEYLKNKT